MKKLVLTIALLFTVLLTSAQVELYQGLVEGMSKKDALKELKQNNDLYSSVDFGNDVVWKVYKQALRFNDKKLSTVNFLSAKGFGMAGTGQNGLIYLEKTAEVLKDKGYEVYLENENWKYPRYWTEKSFKYGLMLINPEKTKVVHLYYTGTSAMATMAIQSLADTKEDIKDEEVEVEGF